MQELLLLHLASMCYLLVVICLAGVRGYLTVI